jgi:hypothetical protein
MLIVIHFIKGKVFYARVQMRDFCLSFMRNRNRYFDQLQVQLYWTWDQTHLYLNQTYNALEE